MSIYLLFKKTLDLRQMEVEKYHLLTQNILMFINAHLMTFQTINMRQVFITTW